MLKFTYLTQHWLVLNVMLGGMCMYILQKYSFVCPVQNHLPSVPENVCNILCSEHIKEKVIVHAFLSVV